MTTEEQKAWDGFAAAALTGLLSAESETHMYTKPQLLIHDVGKYADAMMEQRKARLNAAQTLADIKKEVEG